MRNFYATRRPFLSYLLILVVCLIVYFPVLGKKAVNPDAYVILPQLMSVKHPWDYYQLLSSFSVIDFQPIRDLTFFIDLFIFKTTGIVSFATVNVLLWSMAGLFLLKLLGRLVPEDKKTGVIYWVILFLSYPLFTQAVSWGMARKHILAFALILAATNWFLDWLEGKRGWMTAYLGYVAACLSHPLMIFWPCWAFTYALINGDGRKEQKKLAGVYGLTGLVLLLTNYAYYTIGNPLVSQHFWRLTPDYFNIHKHLFRLGFAFRQIIYPVRFGFLYTPDFAMAFPGFLALLVLAMVVFRFRRDRRIFPWLIFIFMTFPITLTLENFFDQYLIVPACGLLIVAFLLLHRSSVRQSLTLAILAVALGAYTLTQVEVWTDMLKWSDRNFKNYPSCNNAGPRALSSYDKKQKAPAHVVSYLFENGCIAINPMAPGNIYRRNIYLLSRIMFYEADIPRETRLLRLEELGRILYYPQLLYASLLAQEDRAEEVEEASRYVLNITKGSAVEVDELVSEHLRPYCLKKQLPTCLEVTKLPPHLPRPY